MAFATSRPRTHKNDPFNILDVKKWKMAAFLEHKAALKKDIPLGNVRLDEIRKLLKVRYPSALAYFNQKEYTNSKFDFKNSYQNHAKIK